MKKDFTYEFVEGRPNSLTYEISLEENERLRVLASRGIATLCLNHAGMLTMAKLLVRFAAGRYSKTFHLHLREDFGDTGPDALTIMMYPDEGGIYAGALETSGAKREFHYEFEEPLPNRFSLDYSKEKDEKVEVVLDKESTTLCLNRSAMLTLARALIKIAQGGYSEGFCVHFNKDFDAALPHRFDIVLQSDDKTVG
jgi:hypothetical protein